MVCYLRHQHADRADTLGTYVDVAMIGYIVFLLAASAIGFWVGSTIYDAWQEPEDDVVTARRSRHTTNTYAPPKRQVPSPSPKAREVDPARPETQLSSVTTGNSQDGWADTATDAGVRGDPHHELDTSQDETGRSTARNLTMPRIEVPVTKALAAEVAWFDDEEPITEELIAVSMENHVELMEDPSELLLADEGPEEEDDERTFHLDFSQAPHRPAAPSPADVPGSGPSLESIPTLESIPPARPEIQLGPPTRPPPAPIDPSPTLPSTPALVELDEDSDDETLAALWNAEPDSEDLSSYVDPWEAAPPLRAAPRASAEEGGFAPTADELAEADTTPVPRATKVNTEWENTPRNAPCPCGSGRKYKQCHGA